MMRFATLFRVEWVKTMRMLSTYIAFVWCGVLVMMVQLGVYFNHDGERFYQFLVENGISTTILVNAYVSTRIALEVGFVLLVAPMIIQVFARQIAGEDLKGTLRMALSRPVSRLGLFSAKFLVCTAYCILLMGFCIGLSYGVGLVFYGPQDSITIGKFDELDDDQFEDQARDMIRAKMSEQAGLPPEQRKTAREIQRQITRDLLFNAIVKKVIPPRVEVKRLALAWAMTSWALLTIGSIAMFFSVTSKHPIAAMALTVGVYFLVMILQNLANADNVMPLFKKIRPYLFTTAMDFWRECLSYTIDWGELRRKAALLGCYTLVFFGGAATIFWRKDITC